MAKVDSVMQGNRVVVLIHISKTPPYLVITFSTFQYLAILFDLVT